MRNNTRACLALWPFTVLAGAACARPECAHEPHVPLSAVVHQIAAQIDASLFFVSENALLNAFEVQLRPTFQQVRLDSKKCYWLVTIDPTEGARPRRSGVFLFEADTAKLVTEDVRLQKVDRISPP